MHHVIKDKEAICFFCSSISCWCAFIFFNTPFSGFTFQCSVAQAPPRGFASMWAFNEWLPGVKDGTSQPEKSLVEWWWCWGTGQPIGWVADELCISAGDGKQWLSINVEFVFVLAPPVIWAWDNKLEWAQGVGVGLGGENTDMECNHTLLKMRILAFLPINPCSST